MQDNGEDGVSVIVPMYNAATTIERSLASVCEQTYKNLEIIVVDDGSRDASAEIVRKWEKADSRVRLYRHANAGVAAARNAGFAQSSKCLVAFIDADDLWAPDKIRAQVEVLRENSGPALVYCWFVEINELDQVTSAKPEGYVGNVGAQIARWNFVGNASSMLMPRSVFEEAGGFDVELRAQGCEDLLFLMRVAEQVPFRSVPRYLVGYRMTEGNMSSDTRQMRRAFEVVLAKNHQRSPQFAAEHAKHMAGALGWLAARAIASGHHGAAASHLVRLGKIAPLNAARGIYRFGRDSLLRMTGAGRKPLSTTRYQNMAW